MSAPIGPGDWVECINPLATSIAYGALYCVEEVEVNDRLPCECGCVVGVELAGDVRDPFSMWCAGCEVRPIYRPKSTFIDTLKQPAPERELIDA